MFTCCSVSKANETPKSDLSEQRKRQEEAKAKAKRDREDKERQEKERQEEEARREEMAQRERERERQRLKEEEEQERRNAKEAEERRRRQEEVRAEQERQRKEAEEQQRQRDEEERRRDVNAFLKKNGFKQGAATPKKSCCGTTTALHEAAKQKNAGMVRKLLKEDGVDRNAKDSKKKTAADHAKRLNRKDSHREVLDALDADSESVALKPQALGAAAMENTA